ncbi:hypothetical protein BMT55_03470 [Listeria newyorkensis]|uniref:Na+/glutamate symporter n=1 Tax=Listeria newyorkensis TaxID=1497681 RepID=A0ABX4XP71_9LIST|nr:hypothetical protein [Listeria newyorkensis]KGL41308.1 hypothetical protein EP56_12040 [Listeriaceae bacterium FSL A5-0209]KGL44644.1 hypothetical protein EP58_03970 [Listeria newyorkensis]PNP93840.1 hypothetical protein BMT55_03470 [Listeria newyorkensis]WAO22462.1 hypothetical protein OTR81_04095 [Listeria newyorkensis]SQC50885.1 Uncharacterised protein [Listeria newyorkensis]
MNPVTAFTIIMLIWAISDFVSKKTKSLISSLLVASIIFLVGFKTNIFPEDLLSSSSLLALGQTVVGFIIVHIGTMISLDELKKQWRTVVIGVAAVLGIAAFLFLIGSFFLDENFVIAAIGAISGGTISVIIVQESALASGLLLVAVFPVLIAAFQGLIGFPLTSLILRKEANRIKGEYRAGNIQTEKAEVHHDEAKTMMPKALQTTAGTLFVVGVVVMLSIYIDTITNGVLNTFVVALLFGIALRAFGVIKPNILSGIDAYGLMMLAILIIIFGPLATSSVDDLVALIGPLCIAFAIGVSGSVVFSAVMGKILGYSVSMSIAIGLTTLYGFPGTMILSQEAARSVGENEQEIAAIEGQILPKMIIAGFSAVTITSVVLTSILAELIH